MPKLDGTKRTYVRQACDWCRSRKRRCDGQRPCTYCVQHDYECTFRVLDHRSLRSSYTRHDDHDLHVLARPATRTLRSTPAVLDAVNAPLSQVSGDDQDQHQHGLDANAGVLFSQAVSRQLRATSNASQTQAFGWNLGLRSQPHERRKISTCAQIITQSVWQESFETYIQHIHTFYNFLHIETILAQAEARWKHPRSKSANDHILCGVVILANLFVPRCTDAEESALFHCAQDLLTLATLQEPTCEDLQAWLLQTIYLRFTSPPHASWMASCTTVHIAEAVASRWGSRNLLDRPPANSANPESTCHRIAFWLAQLLNTWISWEYGRSSADSRTVLALSLDGQEPDSPTHEFIRLFKLSRVLDPRHNCSTIALENALSELATYQLTDIPLVLSQSTLCFALYRRLRLAAAEVDHTLLDHVILLGRKGLQASLSAARSHFPWWHTSNVPFQFICVLVAMDTTESLSHIGEALSSLQIVRQQFDTPLMRSSLEAAESLIELYRKRKQYAVATLQEALQSQSDIHQTTETDFNIDMQTSIPDQASTAMDLDNMWLNNLLFNFPSFDNTDWAQF